MYDIYNVYTIHTIYIYNYINKCIKNVLYNIYILIFKKYILRHFRLLYDKRISDYIILYGKFSENLVACKYLGL